MRHYRHLTTEQRERLLELLAREEKHCIIAQELKVSESTISRELKRNGHKHKQTGKQRYSPSEAKKLYEKRRKNCHQRKKLEDPALCKKVQELWLEKGWSPEQISYRLKLEKNPWQISTSTLYRGIHDHMLEVRPLRKDERGIVLKLRHKGRKRKQEGDKETRGKLKPLHFIQDRPKSADHRSRTGHWEADTVMGKKNTGAILTLIDRKHRYAMAGKVENKDATSVAMVMIRLLNGLPAEKVKSITPDLGKEFAKYAEVTEAVHEVPFYFAHAHSPWERPTNENFNGLLREYFPKRKSMKDVTDEDILHAVSLLNYRPRKCLDWKTPYESFWNSVLHLT